MPGGLQGVAKAAADFHRRGVKVYIPFTPWDTALGPVNGTTDAAHLAAAMAAIGADGFNGDTKTGIPFR